MNTSNVENLTKHIMAVLETEKVLHPDITYDEVIVALSVTQAGLQAVRGFFDVKVKRAVRESDNHVLLNVDLGKVGKALQDIKDRKITIQEYNDIIKGK